MNEKDFAKKIICELDRSPISLKAQDRLAQARYMALEKIRLKEVSVSSVSVAGGSFQNIKWDVWAGNWRVWLAASLVALAVGIGYGIGYGIGSEIKGQDDEVDDALQMEVQTFRGMVEAIDGVMKSADLE